MKKRKVLLSNENSITVISNENEWIAFIALGSKINNIFLINANNLKRNRVRISEVEIKPLYRICWNKRH